MVIFPEGTRSVDGTLLDFKAGGMMIAIKAGVGVVPMAICGTRHILPKGKILPRAGEVVIRLGDPLDVSGYSLKEKQKLADDLRRQVAELLGQEGCPS